MKIRKVEVYYGPAEFGSNAKILLYPANPRRMPRVATLTGIHDVLHLALISSQKYQDKKLSCSKTDTVADFKTVEKLKTLVCISTYHCKV